MFIRWAFGPEQDSGGGATFKAFKDMFSSDLDELLDQEEILMSLNVK